jgi:AcrR family transcriptional regulator
MTARGQIDKSRIEEAFGRSFQKNGYQATSVESVARELGIPKGSIFHHVGTKEAVFVRLLVESMIEFADLTEQIADSPVSSPERLRIAIRDSVRRSADLPMPPTLSAFEGGTPSLSDEDRNTYLNHRERYERAFSRIISDGISDGVFDEQEEFRLIVFGILRLLGGIDTWYRSDGRLSHMEIADIYWAFFCQSLGFPAEVA